MCKGVESFFPLTRLRTITIGCLSIGALLCAPSAQAENFSVSLSTSRNTAEPGQIVTFTVTVRNNDAKTATGATAALTLHKSLEFKSASNGGTEKSESVQWKSLTVPAGGSLSLNVSAAVDENVKDDEDLFVAAFAGGQSAEVVIKVDDEDVNDNDTDRSVNATLRADTERISAGDTFSYEVRIENEGDRKVNAITASLELDDALEFLSASADGKESGGKVTWSDLDIAGGQTRTLTVSVKASEDLRHNDAVEATLSTEGSADTLNLTVEDGDIGLERTELFAFTEEDDFASEEDIVYTVHLRNEDTRDQVVRLLAHLDQRSSFVSASDDGLRLERYLVEWKDLSIKQNETKTLSLTLKADEDKAIKGSVLETVFSTGLVSRHVRTRVVKAPMAADEMRAEGDQTADAETGDQRSESAASSRSSAASSSSSSSSSASSSRSSRSAPEPEEETSDSAEPQGAAPALLQLSQAADKSEVRPGSVVTFTVTARNEGDLTARNITIVSALDDGIEIESVGGGKMKGSTVTWQVPQLLARDRWQAVYTVRVSEDVAHGSRIAASVSAVVNGKESSIETALNVVDRLPSAGIGAFSLAAMNSASLVRASARPVEAGQFDAASQKTATSNVTQSNAGTFAFAGIVIIAVCLGCTGALLARKTLRL